MKKPLIYAYVCAFFLLFVAPPLLFGLFGQYIDQTNYENRIIAEKPVLSAETLTDFPAAYEAYYNDNLPFRTQMIEANGLIQYHLFRQSPVYKVLIGKDGWFFYNPAGSDGNPIADYSGTQHYSAEALERCAANLLRARDQLRAKGKEFVVFIAPNKSSIYGSRYLPPLYNRGMPETTADQVVAYLRQNTDLTIVYPKDTLLQAVNTNPQEIYYYKTDSHWNALGACIGTKELLGTLDISFPEPEQLQVTKTTPYSGGDLTGMMSLSKYLDDDFHYSVSGYASTTPQPDYPIAGNTNLLHYSVPAADNRTLFMVRDSYATEMIPLLSTRFSNSYVAHISIWNPQLLNDYPADVVVLEVVERYLYQLSGFTVE